MEEEVYYRVQKSAGRGRRKKKDVFVKVSSPPLSPLFHGKTMKWSGIGDFSFPTAEKKGESFIIVVRGGKGGKGERNLNGILIVSLLSG